jgi:hypothetical protein
VENGRDQFGRSQLFRFFFTTEIGEKIDRTKRSILMNSDLDVQFSLRTDGGARYAHADCVDLSRL